MIAFFHGFALVRHCFVPVKFTVYKFNTLHMKANFFTKSCSFFSKPTIIQNSPGVKLFKVVICHLLLASIGLINRILVGCEWRIIIFFKIDTLGHKHLSPVTFFFVEVAMN